MSKTKRTRLNDQPIEGFADLEEDLSAPGPSAGRAGTGAVTSREPAPAAAAPVAASPRVTATRRRASSAPSLPWGVLFTASVIAAGVGMGGVTLLLTGGHAANTWKMGDLFNAAYYFAPAVHPLNLLALVALAVGTLAALGGRALETSWHRARREHSVADRLLDKLTALRLDNEGPWSDPGLRDHPAAGTFVAEVLGAWRLQGARLRRVNGVEGEVVRLQKALADNVRDALTSRFESTAVGSLADDLVKFLDARQADAQELAELRRGRREETDAVMTLIQEARGWNRATLEQIGAQGASLERLARRLEDLGRSLGAPDHAADGQAAALLADIRQELDAQGAGAEAPGAGLEGLAAQGSKLAFQISMEVAQLGPRGERLQPLSRSLEDLTTSLRQAVTAGAAGKAPLGAVLGKIDVLTRQMGQGGVLDPEALQEIGRSGPAAGKAAANLADVARRFQAQADRLLRLGEAVASLTGVTFDATLPAPAAATEAPAESGWRETPQDPFCRDKAGPVEVDPFATDAPLVAPPAPPVLAPEAPVFVAPPPAAPVADESFIIERTSTARPVFEHPATGPAPLGLESMPAASDGADPASGPASPFGTVFTSFSHEPVQEDPIHELSEFGAVRIDAEPASRDTAADRVFDLSEFGAVRVA